MSYLGSVGLDRWAALRSTVQGKVDEGFGVWESHLVNNKESRGHVEVFLRSRSDGFHSLIFVIVSSDVFNVTE